MNHVHRSPLLAFVLMMATATAVMCAEQEGPTYTDPQKAGPDFETQGEYLGKLQGEEGEEAWGAQVIALGDGKFSIVGYQGGLPGAGWRRGDPRKKGEGSREDDVVTLKGDKWSGTIQDGELTVSNDDQKTLGTLKKVDRESPTLGAKPSEGAVVLFAGESAEHFKNGQLTEEGLLQADTESLEKFGDHTLHIEFRTPFKPHARGQARGNSGVYVQSRYEVQVLDSFGLEGENNECGGIYSIARPLVNMCLPPLSWQTYDYDLKAARYNDQGEKVENARITMRHNGVVIHDDLELPHGTPGRLPEGPDPAPLYLQGHGNPVVYRNIWAVKK